MENDYSEDAENEESPEHELSELHARAIRAFNASYTAQKEERLQCLQDRRFYSIAGAQWEGDLSKQFENKPKFEFNKIRKEVIRIYDNYKKNNIGIKFITKDGGEDKETDAVAKLYRADTVNSDTEEALDTAFLDGVGGGIGALRVTECYEDELDDENDRQRIKIEPIFDADASVFYNIDAKRQDKSDATECWVLKALTPEFHEEEYGGKSLSSMPRESEGTQFDWFSPDVVYIAEYYRCEKQPHTVYVYRDLQGNEIRYTDEDFEADPELKPRLKAIGTKKIKTKKVLRKRIHKYIMDGARILEDCGFIAGSEIPIVPYYGMRWVIDNVERASGHVRLAKDPMRIFNMMLSKLASISAGSSSDKPIFTSEQIKGHELIWQDDPVEDYSYLTINSMTGANGEKIAVGAVGTLVAPNVPPTMAALIQLVGADIKDLLGSSDEADRMVGNVSGEAVGLIQQRLDVHSGVYMTNFAKALKRIAEVWLSKARELYVEPGRKMRGVAIDGTAEQIELMRKSIDKKGKPTFENNLSKASFDVVADVGPTSQSQRQAINLAILNMLPLVADPEAQNVLVSTAMMNLEGEGLSNTREYFRRRLLAVGAVEPTDEERKQMEAAAQNQQPDPQAMYLQAAAAEAQADAAKKQVDAVKAQAETEKIRAQTAETLAGIDQKNREQLLETAQLLADASSATVARTGTTPPQEGEIS